jgi:hypothetical protein
LHAINAAKLYHMDIAPKQSSRISPAVNSRRPVIDAGINWLSAAAADLRAAGTMRNRVIFVSSLT